MASVMSSHSVILTTAMAVSGAVIFLSLSRIKNLPFTHQLVSNNPSSNSQSSPLRPCLSSDRKRREKKEKKRVKFADNVKEEKAEIQNTSEKKKKRNKEGVFLNEKTPEFQRMPANRAALYHGILRDRVHRVECSYS